MDIILLAETEKRRALKELVTKAPSLSSFDQSRLLKALWRRERIQSTALGHGVAVPNPHVRDIDHVRVVLGLSKEGIDFDSPDSRPVHLLFLVISNQRLQDAYLKSLRTILSFAREPEIRFLLDDWDEGKWSWLQECAFDYFSEFSF